MIRSEMHVPSVTIQFGLILEAYCRANEQHLRVLTRQVESLARLKKVSDDIKVRCGEIPLKHRHAFLIIDQGHSVSNHPMS